MRALPRAAPSRSSGAVRHGAKYLAIAGVTLATQTAYLGEMALRTVFLGSILFIFVQLWTVTYAEMGQTTIAGFGVAQMIWYLMITESILISRPRVSREIDQDVRSGDVGYQLIRPYDFVLFRLAAYAGERLPRFGISLLVGTVVTLVLVGPIDLDPTATAAAAVVLLLGATIDFLGAVTVGLCAFWIEDTQPLALLYDRSIMLLGGLLLPLELFPDAIASVLGYLPFQLLLYAPARLAVTGDMTSLPTTLLALGVTLLVGFLMTGAIYRLAARRLLSNGG